jgi:uncharacterized phosphosugar-binding protein
MLHAIFAQAIAIMAEQGGEPLAWMSGNIPDGKEHHQNNTKDGLLFKKNI